MNFKLWLAPALLCGAMLAGCIDDIPGVDAKEKYTRDFVKEFGVFDPKQDWNVCKQAVVKVTTSKRTTIQIYADVDGQKCRFGTFTNVLGENSLKVDVPKNVNNLIIKANGRTYYTTDGGTVSISSRAIADPKEDDFLKWDDLGKDTFSSEVIKGFFDQFQEGQPNLGVGTSSFYFISDGQWHTFYPLFSQTNKCHALGIYYIPDMNKPDEIVMQDLYFTKTGDLVVMQGDQEIGEAAYRGWTSIPSNCTSTARGITYWVKEGIYYGFYLKCSEISNAEDPNLDANFFTTTEEDQIVKPNPVEEQKHIFTVFSQGTRNKIWEDWDNGSSIRETKYKYQKGIREEGWANTSWWDDELYTELDKYSYASWCEADVYVNGELKTYTYFGFEDWPSAQGNLNLGCDLNDLMFVFEGIAPEATDEDTAATWIIACEDLGLNDFDFNDVILGISDIQTDMEDPENPKTKFKVHALAAGGTLPIYIMLNGEEIIPEGTNEGEYHSWFEGNHTSSTVINAGGYKAKGKTVDVEVDGVWTLAANTDVTIDDKNGQGRYGNMGGFSVRVKNDNKNLDKEWRYIEAPSPKGLNNEIGEAPQMICVPGSWYWPTEMTHITKCYPHFTKWCDPDDKSEESENWYKIHSGSNVVRHNFGAKGSSSGGGNDFTNGPIDPKFTLTTSTITYGITSQIKVGRSSDLDGITLSNIRCNPEGVVEVNPTTGVITPLKGIDGPVTITFNSSEVDKKYKSSEDNELTITVNKLSPYFSLQEDKIEVGSTTHILLNGNDDLSGLDITISVGNRNSDNGNVNDADFVQVDNSGLVTGLAATDSPAVIWIEFNGNDIYSALKTNVEVTVVPKTVVPGDWLTPDQDGFYTLTPDIGPLDQDGWAVTCIYHLNNIKDLDDAISLEIIPGNSSTTDVHYGSGTDELWAYRVQWKNDCTIESGSLLSNIISKKCLSMVYYQYSFPLNESFIPAIKLKVNK
ncbi:MAG: DUF4842 domain-containing protein [Duncaniella sp.]|nr:DUF4842 domain-containing protein [Duncaniella sp.]